MQSSHDSPRSSFALPQSRYVVRAALYMVANVILFLTFSAAAVGAPLFVTYVSWSFVTSEPFAAIGFSLVGLGGILGSVLTAATLVTCLIPALGTSMSGRLTTDERLLDLVRTVTDAVGVDHFEGVLLTDGVNASTFYAADGRFLVLSPLLLRYLTTNELAAVVAHECAHHHHGAMLVNRIHYRSLTMFFNYYQAIMKVFSAVERVPLLRPAGLPVLTLIPLLRIYAALMEQQGVMLRNAEYEFYCDSVAVTFAGATVFRAALQKLIDLQLSEQLTLDELEKKAKEDAENGSSRSADSSTSWYFDEFERQFERLRTVDSPKRTRAAEKGSPTHPSTASRLARAGEHANTGGRDLSSPLYDKAAFQTRWPHQTSAEAASQLLRVEAELDFVRTRPPDDLCHFCGAHTAQRDHAISIVMHGNVRTVQVHEVFDVTRVVWDTHTLEVPRCAECSRAHGAVASAKGWSVQIGMVGTVAFVVFALWWWRYAPTADYAALYLAAGAAFGLGTSIALWGNAIHLLLDGRARQETKYTFDAVREYSARGWKLGKAPSASAGSPPRVEASPQRGFLDSPWLRSFGPFRRFVGSRSVFITMPVLVAPIPLILAVIPLTWLLTASTPEAALDLHRIGLLDKTRTFEQVSAAAADLQRPADERLKRLRSALDLRPSPSEVSQAALRNVQRIAYSPDPFMASTGRELLRTLAPETVLKTDIEYLSSSNLASRETAARHLGSMGLQGSEAVNPLLAATRDSNPGVRKAATTALLAISYDATLPVLIEMLADSDSHMRVFAISLLFQMRGAAVAALPALQNATRDPDRSVREMAELALRHVTSASPK